MILMDEPSMGLSPPWSRKCSRSRQINRDLGVTILWWRTRAALSVASHGYIMEQGKVVLDGTADELRDNEDVRNSTWRRRRSAQELQEPESFKRRKRWL
jgi:branched-chain amino acid transport system ATP-binding protein